MLSRLRTLEYPVEIDLVCWDSSQLLDHSAINLECWDSSQLFDRSAFDWKPISEVVKSVAKGSLALRVGHTERLPNLDIRQ